MRWQVPVVSGKTRMGANKSVPACGNQEAMVTLNGPTADSARYRREPLADPPPVADR